MSLKRIAQDMPYSSVPDMISVRAVTVVTDIVAKVTTLAIEPMVSGQRATRSALPGPRMTPGGCAPPRRPPARSYMRAIAQATPDVPEMISVRAVAAVQLMELLCVANRRAKEVEA